MKTDEDEVFIDNMIVEFSYDLNEKSKWNWKPLRIRYDKTIDNHAIDCTLYELKTGIIKYNPDLLKDDDTENNYSLDYYHILLFLKDEIIKESWLKSCKKYDLLDELKNVLN
jgi:hypothetical protein